MGNAGWEKPFWLEGPLLLTEVYMAGLNETPSGERLAIGFFGVRNAGKSSLVNAVCAQDVALVSDVAGTTTDPVRKSMELLPLGPVTIIDTPGIDDVGELGEARVARTRRVLEGVDVAVLVLDSSRGMTPADEELVTLFEANDAPFVTVWSKADLLEGDRPDLGDNALYASSETREGVRDLKELVARIGKRAERERRLIGDMVLRGDVVVLVCPIDVAAPKGRIILPQVQTIRDLLDSGALPLVCQTGELPMALESLENPPALVVTDSQVFGEVSRIVPDSTPLTSFSILMARYKGDLSVQVAGANAIDALKEGDRILIAEGCTHHRQCDDIGTNKLPNWIRKHVGCDIAFDFTSGAGFPDDLSPYALVLHCGGCMLTPREVESRLRRAAAQGVPFTNYGVAIAKLNGILPRVLSPFDR